MTTATHITMLTRATKNADKVNSVVFQPEVNSVDPIVTSVYLMRPMSTSKTKARITVEFLD